MPRRGAAWRTGCAAADVLGPRVGAGVRPPIVRTAVYESIPPGERALAHAEAARLLDAEGAEPERTRCTCCAASRPVTRVVSPCCARPRGRRAAAAPGRPRPATCAGRSTNRPTPSRSPPCCWNSGLALARRAQPGRAGALRDAVRLTADPDEHARRPCCRPPGVLGIWGHHAAATEICREALAGRRRDRPGDARHLQAGAFANSMIDAATAAEAVAPGARPAGDPDASAAWQAMPR